MIYLLVGLIAGLFGAMTGLGGGIIMVPVMTIFLDVPIHKAVGVSLFAILVNSSISSVSYAKKGFTDFKLGLALEHTTVVGAVVGALLAGIINGRVLEIIFAIVLLFASLQMMSPMRNLIAEQELRIRKLTPIYRVKKIKFGVALGTIAGCVAGMLGVGGGIFKIPIMYLVMDVPVKVAVATSSFMIMLTSAAGAWVFFLRGDIYIELALFISCGVALGSYVGSRIGIKLRGKWQTRLIASLLFIAALRMLISLE